MVRPAPIILGAMSTVVFAVMFICGLVFGLSTTNKNTIPRYEGSPGGVIVLSTSATVWPQSDFIGAVSDAIQSRLGSSYTFVDADLAVVSIVNAGSPGAERIIVQFGVAATAPDLLLAQCMLQNLINNGTMITTLNTLSPALYPHTMYLRVTIAVPDLICQSVVLSQTTTTTTTTTTTAPPSRRGRSVERQARGVIQRLGSG